MTRVMASPPWLQVGLPLRCLRYILSKGDLLYGHAARHAHPTRSAGRCPDRLYPTPLVARDDGPPGAPGGSRTPYGGRTPGYRSADSDHSTPAPGATPKSGTCVACVTPPFDNTHQGADRNAAHGTFTKILRTRRAWENLSYPRIAEYCFSYPLLVLTKV
jgi:hypothetical protein